MKLVLAIVSALLGAVLLINTAQAQPRIFNQAELDAMLAPIALQPDPVVSHILIAATHPEDVAEAARWSRANPQLRAEDAVRAVQNEPWHPSVKALVAFPDLLSRMDESPQWLGDLGEAFVNQQPHVMETVQQLRRRAQAAGHLANNDYQSVYQYGQAIAVQPRAEYVYVPYYNPYVVYGPWWWPHYQPVFWSPWVSHPVFVTHVHHKRHVHKHHVHPVHKHHVHPVHRPTHLHKHPVPKHVIVTPHHRVPEAQRQPIAQSAPPLHRVAPPLHRAAPLLQQGLHKVMPAANGFSHSPSPTQTHQFGKHHQPGNGLRKHRG